jgi:hypothetical protein
MAPAQQQKNPNRQCFIDEKKRLAGCELLSLFLDVFPPQQIEAGAVCLRLQRGI